MFIKRIKQFFVVSAVLLAVFVLMPTSDTLAAETLSYESPNYYEVDVSSVNLSPTISGSGYTFSISPDLPSGLVISSSTGVISGTPYVYSPETTYTVTATNPDGSTSFDLKIATLVRPRAFNYEYYQTPHFFTINKTVDPSLITSLEQTGVTYSISPSLPDGISINSETGEIGGFATELSSLTAYTITAYNNLGSTTASVSIAVPMPWIQLGDDINGSATSQSDFKFDKNGVPYVVYNDAYRGGGAVLKYDKSSKSWIQFSGPINNGTGEQYKIIFDKSNNLLVSYVLDKKVFIKKFNSSTFQWVGMSSVYGNVNNPTEETGSSISNTAVSHDMVADLGGSGMYESYVNQDGTLNISKLISNTSGGGSIDNIDDPQKVTNFSYNKTDVVFGTGTEIDPIIPTASGSPLYFGSFPELPAGLSIDRSGIIFGAPIVETPKTVYSIFALNEIDLADQENLNINNFASTTIAITTVGPLSDTTFGLNVSRDYNFDNQLISDGNGGYYYSYYIKSSGDSSEKEETSKNIIKKYDSNLAIWSENLFTGEDNIASDGIYSADVAMAMAEKNGELYGLFLDFFMDEYDSDSQPHSIEYLKKYNATSSTWDILGQRPGSSDVYDMNTIKLVFSGADLFVLDYASNATIYVNRFNLSDNEFYPIGEFTSGASGKGGPLLDTPSVVADDNYLYLGYSDNGDGLKVVVKRLDKTKLLGDQTEFWDSWDIDSSAEEYSLKSINLDSTGVPYVLYYNDGDAVISKLNTETNAFDVFIDDYGDFTAMTIDDDNNIFVVDNYVKKYVDGQWVNFINEDLTGVNNSSTELFFNADGGLYLFVDGSDGSMFLKYTDKVAPVNYDYSIPPVISYSKNVLNYVVGKRIEPVIFNFSGGSVDSSSVTWICPDEDNTWNCLLPSGLSRSNFDSLMGTPLVAGTINLILYADNEVGSSTFPLTINIFDPWVPLSDPISASAKEVDTDVSGNDFFVTYSEYSGADLSNHLFVKKYSEETWSDLGGEISTAGEDVLNPQIVSEPGNFIVSGHRDIYVAYLDKNSNKLLVKKYDYDSDSWVQLGGEVSSSYSDYFNLQYDYNSGEISIIFYDNNLGKSIVKSYHNGYWELVGSYIDGKFPVLTYNKNNISDGIYVATSNTSGVLRMENYKEIDNSGKGKEVSLSNIVNLATDGDASPQSGGAIDNTKAIRFNQKINIIPFAGASISIPSLTVMSASSTFNMASLTASSTVDLHNLNVGNFTLAGTLMFGLPDLGLTLNSPITITIPVTGVAEGKQLQVYSKTAGSDWSSLTTCYVIGSRCSFQTTHLSEFAAGTINVPVSGGGGSYTPPADVTCTDVTYSAFSNICSGGFFTRSVLTSLPSGCSLSTAQLAALKQACVMPEEENPEEITATSSATSTATSTVDVVKDTVTTVLKEVKDAFIKLEKSLIKTINKLLTKKLLGRILLQVESHGEAWYLDPISSSRYYLADGETAYSALRQFGLGITNANIAKIPVGSYSYKGDIDTDKDGLSDKIENGLGTNPNLADSDKDGVKDGDEVLKKNTNPLNKTKLSYSTSLINRLKGRIVIQTEKKGEAWYINPADGKRYYLADGPMAYQVMRFLSLGITNNNIRQIKIGEMK